MQKKLKFRQRVYQLPDLSIQIVFGSDPAPEGGKLLADQDVEEVCIVTPHVEPQPPDGQ